MDINIGINASDRNALAESLAKLLADSYSLYLKTHNYHWNVEGPMFNTLHLMFETHYTELAVAVDLIAERIRALGVRAPGSYHEFAALSKIQENTTSIKAEAMIEDLVVGHEAVVSTARTLIPLAEKAGDDATADLATQRIALHEKTAWMLRSLLA